MSVLSFRPIAEYGLASPLPGEHWPDAEAPAVAPEHSEARLSTYLIREGVVAAHHMLAALAEPLAQRGRLTDAVLARGLAVEPRLYRALSEFWGIGLADLTGRAPDPRLIDRIGAVRCLSEGLLPWMRLGEVTVVATAYPEDFARHRDALERALDGPVAPALAGPRAIEAALLAVRGPDLARAAETRVALADSCRNWRSLGQTQVLILALTLALLVAAFPVQTLGALSVWAVLTLAASAVLKLLALWKTAQPAAASDDPPPLIARLPVVSIIVALYREADIAPRLVRRLGKLDYPRELLDVVLVVEEDDAMTRAALARSHLPDWMRVVVAPEGRVKTKPRALNYALDHCRGSIVGVYDAEDAPEPDQIRKVVDRFHQRGAQVACLQGVLDYYNPRTNWLSRCFTVEYAAWFRVVLPGLERLGLAVPLGGTTLFFRRAALQELGGWDAHNVTEDADLGMRLARRGYRTELIATTTFEEANCRPLPWIKQRSRWIKGYMMTYATHMRAPVQLWRDLGPRAFLGFQVLFLGSLSQALLVPLLWSYWLLAFGLPHPVAGLAPAPLVTAIVALFLASELVTIFTGIIGLRRTGHRLALAWVPTLHFYHPLAALASYKAAWELLVKPFYWDKTRHGLFDQAEDATAPDPQRVRNSPASMRSRVS